MDRCDEGRRIARSLLLLLGLPTLIACGNLTAGGIGEASVAMSGDAPDDTTAPQTAVVASPADGGSSPAISAEPWGGPLTTDHLDGDEPEGEVEAELSVFLMSADGDLIALTEGDVRVRVDLRGAEEPEIGSRTVSAATYTTLRMVFTDIDVEVDSGVVIDGVPIVGPVDVEIEDVLTVDRTIAVEIADGERVDLLIDLNSEAWLQAVDPVTSTVDAQVFADLVTVLVR